jgi:hypothetical protein
MEAMQLGGTAIDVVRRDIKHVHLSVHPPEGRVRLAAPHRTSIDSLRLFAIEKLGWIRTQQQRMQGQDREPPRAFVDRESHYVWGRRCLLRVIEVAARPSVEARPRSLLLQVRPGASHERRAAVLEEWYRDQVRTAAAPPIGPLGSGARRPSTRDPGAADAHQMGHLQPFELPGAAEHLAGEEAAGVPRLHPAARTCPPEGARPRSEVRGDHGPADAIVAAGSRPPESVAHRPRDLGSRGDDSRRSDRHPRPGTGPTRRPERSTGRR